MIFKEIDFKKIAITIANDVKFYPFDQELQRLKLIASIHDALTKVSIQRLDEVVDVIKEAKESAMEILKVASKDIDEDPKVS